MLTSSDITVYHRSVINGAAVFTRSVVEHVHWENRKAANVIASGMIDADSSVGSYRLSTVQLTSRLRMWWYFG